jgi:hypothetical protein
MARLDTFIRENKLKPGRVASEAGVSRQQLLRLRKGLASARINTGVRLVLACARLLGRTIALDELFDIEGDDR